jgi:alkylation response protein AidB-like acyl-CoA dehydrogenase
MCLAVTEPYAGSDVASIRCSARREGDYYVVNGYYAVMCVCVRACNILSEFLLLTASERKSS